MQNHMVLVIASILCNPFVKERETMEEFCWLGKETKSDDENNVLKKTTHIDGSALSFGGCCIERWKPYRVERQDKRLCAPLLQRQITIQN